MSTKDSLGDRMKKNYENRSRHYLTRRTPVILRLDGKAFHTFTRGCVKPFDPILQQTMVDTTKTLMKEIQGAKIGYTQSDEISILVTDFDTIKTAAWFDYNIQKMCSVAASIASVNFTLGFNDRECGSVIKPAHFDCRAFNIPKEDVYNYFYWRWLDWERNSLQMLAQYHFSHKKLQGKGRAALHEMLMAEKDVNWNDLHPMNKNGTFAFNDGIVMHYNLRNDDGREGFTYRLNRFLLNG